MNSTIDNFLLYGISPESFKITKLGAIEYIENAKQGADTAFLFGMLTLISERPAFFGGLRRLGISTLIIDTHILPGEVRPIFELFRAATQEGNAIIADRTHNDGWMIGLTPSLSALTAMLEHFGWSVTRLDWSRLQDHPDMRDYKVGRRVSLCANLRPSVSSIPA